MPRAGYREAGGGAVPGVLLCILAAVAQGWAGLHSIQYVETQDIPQLREGRMYYSLNIVFDVAPLQHWTYYDRASGELVVDFYGVTLRSPEITMERSTVFFSFSVVNLATTMSLSGERAQIRIGADAGWNIESRVYGGASLQLTVWRPIARPVEKRRVNWWVPATVLAPLLAGVAVFVTVRAVLDGE